MMHLQSTTCWLPRNGWGWEVMILHMAILILLSAEFSSSWGVRPLFLAVPKAWAASSALADSVRQGEVCDCSPGLTRLPGNSPGQVSHGPPHLHCHPAPGTATTLLTQKSHLMLTECFVVRHGFLCSWSFCVYIKRNWFYLLVLNF